MDGQFNYRKMQQQSGGSRKKPVASADPRNHRNSTKNIEMKTINKPTGNQRESRLRWVDENEDAELEKGSISSEEEVAFDTNTDPRMRARNVQDIWNRGEVECRLKALPGSDELSTFLELGNEAGLVNHTYGQTTGLLLAAWRGNARMLATLFEFGASPCVTDAEGRTPLHLASCAGAADCVHLLLLHKAPVQVWDSDHRATPLHCAASSGNLMSLRLLLKAGADVNAGLAGRSALHYAVQSNAVDCVSELLKAGACPNTPQVYTETPLHVAAAMGSTVCIRLLLEHGADVRVQFGPQKTTALHLAAEDENAECVKLLLDAGAEINVRNHRQQTPLHIAALAQTGETMELLLQRGADPNAEDTDGRTPLHSAIVKISRSCECVRLLLDAGANVNKPDAFGYTPLHIAALNEISSCVYLLLTYGGDVTARTNGGVSALSFIVRRTPDILPRILAQLDASIKLHDHEIGDTDCELKLDFHILVPSVERGESGLLLSFIEVGQRHILKHPLCETFLFLKWKRIRKYFILSLLFHTIFVLLYSAYVIGVFLKYCPMESTKGTDNDKNICHIHTIVKLIGYALLGFNMLLISKEVFQMFHSWAGYVQQWENWLQWLIIISVFPCILPFHNADNGSYDILTWQHHVAAIGIFLTWLELMMLVGRFPIFGLYVQMFTTVAVNFAKFLLAYSCLLIAFSLSFGVLFPNYKSFTNVVWSILKTIVMMSGELEFEDIFYSTESPISYPITAHIIFLAFVLLVTVILTNLMVGLAVNDIQGLQQSAGLDRIVRQVELIAHLESMLFSRLLQCLPKKLLTFFHRSALLTSSYHRSVYIKPNDPRERRFPRELVKNVYHLVANRKEKSKRFRYGSTSSDTGHVYADGDYVKIRYSQARYSVKSEGESIRESYHNNRQPNSRHTDNTAIDQILSNIAALSEDLQQRDAMIIQQFNLLTDEINALRKDFKSTGSTT